MATSGTVSTTVFNTSKVIDHALRRCGLTPQQITSEHVDTAFDLLWLYLSSIPNIATALWAIDRVIVPIYESNYEIPLPLGTVDVKEANLRTLTRLATGTITSSEGDATNAFDGDLTTACTQAAAAGNIQIKLDSPARASSFGIMPNATGTWSIIVQASNDGSTWTDLHTDTAFEAVDGEWQWFDVQGVKSWLYYRLLGVGATVLDVTEFYIGTEPREINMARLNLDSFSNLSNKTRLGRPTQFWYDKARTRPVMNVWASPAAEYTFSQIVAFTQRHIQDVGTMVQELEVPQRWYLAIVARLALDCCREIKEADRARLPEIDASYQMEERRAFTGEGDGSSSRLTPNIGVYTR